MEWLLWRPTDWRFFCPWKKCWLGWQHYTSFSLGIHDKDVIKKFIVLFSLRCITFCRGQCNYICIIWSQWKVLTFQDEPWNFYYWATSFQRYFKNYKSLAFYGKQLPENVHDSTYGWIDTRIRQERFSSSSKWRNMREQMFYFWKKKVCFHLAIHILYDSSCKVKRSTGSI